MRSFVRLVVVSILIYATCGVSFSNDVHAFLMNVNRFDDAVDLSPGDGFCDIDADLVRRCSLRAAIQEANAYPGPDTIVIHPGTYTLSIAGKNEDSAATGDLDILEDLTIESEDSSVNATTIVDAGLIDRVFDIHGSDFANQMTVNFFDFTIKNGQVVGGTGRGGAGIYSLFAKLLLNGMIIDHNEALGVEHGGGLGFSSSTADIKYSAFSSNGANVGAAISSEGISELTISHTTINDNYASVAAAGINNDGKMHLSNVTISGNTAKLNTAITSSYIPPTEADTPQIQECTIVSNTATQAGDAAGLYLDYNSKISLLNTIIANTAGGSSNCGFDSTGAGFLHETYNISSDDSCGFVGAGDMVNTDPILGPLTNNGGRTRTHLPQKGSPVINAGLNIFTTGLETDQRGVKRPQDGRVDIGSVEVEYECSFFVIKAKNGHTAAFCL